ncbi:hypothetical protein GCM10027402_32630 [Arthrobacter monumenti]
MGFDAALGTAVMFLKSPTDEVRLDKGCDGLEYDRAEHRAGATPSNQEAMLCVRDADFTE